MTLFLALFLMLFVLSVSGVAFTYYRFWRVPQNERRGKGAALALLADGTEYLGQDLVAKCPGLTYDVLGSMEKQKLIDWRAADPTRAWDLRLRFYHILQGGVDVHAHHKS
ncbi:MAG: hypothetical protein Q7R83_02210 [bacterium]|nr:hypothetical protein [bacterium]